VPKTIVTNNMTLEKAIEFAHQFELIANVFVSSITQYSDGKIEIEFQEIEAVPEPGPEPLHRDARDETEADDFDYDPDEYWEDDPDNDM